MGISAPLAGLTIFILLFSSLEKYSTHYSADDRSNGNRHDYHGALIGMGYTCILLSSMIAISDAYLRSSIQLHILLEFSGPSQTRGRTWTKLLKSVVRPIYLRPMLYTSITSSVGFYSRYANTNTTYKYSGGFCFGTGILLAFVITYNVYAFLLVSRMNNASFRKVK